VVQESACKRSIDIISKTPSRKGMRYPLDIYELMVSGPDTTLFIREKYSRKEIIFSSGPIAILPRIPVCSG